VRIRFTWVVLVAALAKTASADPEAATADAAAQAKQHMELGTRYYSIQQFNKASDEYQAAYLLDPRPEYLYALAQAQREAGDCVKAIRTFENFLHLVHSEKYEALANTNIERCKHDLAEHPPSEGPPKPGPDRPPVAPPPETHVSPPPPAPPPEPSPWYRDWVGHAFVASGTVAAITGAVLFVSGRKTIDDASSAPTYADFLAQQGSLSSAHTKQEAGVAAMAVGGGLVVAGVAHYFFHSSTSSEHPVSATVTPGKAMLVFTRSF
jgi:tetratricopeptide (TPR) repeat protein